MDVTQTTAATPSASGGAASAAAPAADTDQTTINTDFDTFLKLLTTQMQNQDPLKPMDSTEFVSQLASFSSVEQQIRSNDQLEKILEALGGNSPAGLSSWIGKEVRAATQASYTGVPVDIATSPLADADRATLVVRNDFDQVVAQRAVDPEATSVTWDGKDALGNALPNGAYSFAVESYQRDNLLGTAPGEVYAQVTEVRIEDGLPTLVLANGSKVSTDAVTALR